MDWTQGEKARLVSSLYKRILLSKLIWYKHLFLQTLLSDDSFISRAAQRIHSPQEAARQDVAVCRQL